MIVGETYIISEESGSPGILPLPTHLAATAVEGVEGSLVPLVQHSKGSPHIGMDDRSVDIHSAPVESPNSNDTGDTYTYTGPHCITLTNSALPLVFLDRISGPVSPGVTLPLLPSRHQFGVSTSSEFVHDFESSSCPPLSSFDIQDKALALVIVALAPMSLLT
ncbi:hypothetical protein BDP27DRAFT_1417917 [Rhodocollybia butyracea]|uniref:Uncharacterized protein n=1 Tax=Rhodocollybia butyracea TaxID=206335 RepID=A0A9P5UBX0_9AGAR|nr:hypothetical protein BDP27DRAFT_1417917 [Rhodocollybia butyracea]